MKQHVRQLIPFYQPVVNAKGECVGGEILTRVRDVCGKYLSFEACASWIRKHVSPGELPLLLLQQTLCYLEAFPGRRGAGKFLTFNLDASECNNDILPLISPVCQAFRHEKIQLICELTEKEPWLFDSGQRYFLEQLLRSGCELALDDFGTGFNYPHLITESGAKYMKIAGSVISQITHAPLSHAYPEGIILTAKKAGMQVIAEGVETHYQRVWLTKHGVELFQGFYFSPPLTPEQFWLNDF